MEYFVFRFSDLSTLKISIFCRDFRYAVSIYVGNPVFCLISRKAIGVVSDPKLLSICCELVGSA